MRRDRQTEAQLLAMANSAERANRPRTIVIIGVLVAIAALVLVFVQAFGFVSTRGLLEQRLTEAETVDAYAERQRLLDAGEIDLTQIFPPNPSMADIIESLATEYASNDPRYRVNVSVIDYTSPAIFQGDPALQSADVRASFNSVDTEGLFGWIESVLAEPELEGIFVRDFDITPREPGRWNGNVNFRRYVYRETAR